MKKIVLAGLIGLGAGVAVTLAAPWNGSSLAQDGFSDSQKTAIEQIVRDYLTKNPDILIEMSSELERRQAEAQAQAQTEAIKENAEALFKSENAPFIGNPDGDVTVVEFFDYNCGYCRRALEHVMKLVETDKNVKVVFKEFPIFGEDSEAAAKAALAADKQGKYAEMHTRLYNDEGKPNLDKALKIAADLGLDVEKLKTDMNDPSVTGELEKTKSLAEALGVQGTPLYVVGGEIVPGAPDNLHEVLVTTAEEVRKKNCGQGC
jgi:protein-disulfide isomerase